MSRQPAAKHPRPMRKPVSQTPGWLVPAAALSAVVLVVVGLLVIRWYTTPQTALPLAPDATQQIVSSLASIPGSEFESVGAGSAKESATDE